MSDILSRQVVKYCTPVYRQKICMTGSISELVRYKWTKIVQYFMIEEGAIQDKIDEAILEDNTDWVLNGEPDVTEFEGTFLFNITMNFEGSSKNPLVGYVENAIVRL